MLKASELKIMPIRDLDIYYRCHTRDTTSLSIHIDGLTIYTLDIRGVLTPESGTDTVGAFSSDDKRSLVAWIDPKTGTFISSDSTFYDSLLGIPVLALMIVCAAALLGLAGGSLLRCWASPSSLRSDAPSKDARTRQNWNRCYANSLEKTADVA
ncbi:hypothetical protein WK09_26370 [Burkholderia ubonensis]|uniref:hypothetical protein n=1 Tax=Burkholderia ubonensis TaxID=101571 RepID=UPI000756348D|nr:hypothetical protein [Burkholderia ubonensis]KVR06410.1 hypothetical protein WK09_26370 [Burkholderia ubonensis]KVX15013.1 hypothetical protein WL03_15890 [Burkholderia ubonensis]KWC07642.1 hypothetical protein WL43_15535 [Burkholderia ubonensis]